MDPKFEQHLRARMVYEEFDPEPPLPAPQPPKEPPTYMTRAYRASKEREA